MVDVSLVIKIILVVVLPIENVVGAIVPALLRGETVKAFAHIVGAAMMLGVGAAHLVPQAVNDLSHVDTKMFPLAYYLVLVGYFLTLFIDSATTTSSSSGTKATSSQESNCCGPTAVPAATTTTTTTETSEEALQYKKALRPLDVTGGLSQPLLTGQAPQQESKPLVGKAIVALVAMSVHDFLTGLALGAASTTSGTVTISIAIVSHEWACGGSLMLMFLGACKLGKKLAISLLCIFVLVAPAGIVLGIVLVNVLSNNSTARHVVIGSLVAVAAGTFFYLGIHCLLLTALKSHKFILLKLILLVVLSTLVAVTAIWCEMGKDEMSSMPSMSMPMLH